MIRYTLKINNVTKYVGTNTKFELLAVDDCIRINNIVDIYFIDDISVQVEITTNGGSETSPLTKYDYECSNAYNSKVVYKDYWWSIILVVISSAILLGKNLKTIFKISIEYLDSFSLIISYYLVMYLLLYKTSI